MSTVNKEKVIIVGGGFAGLNLAKRLSRSEYEVVLIDRNNYHSFPPLFYQVASAGIDPSGICFPLRREIRKWGGRENVKFNMTRVRSIDTEAQTVTTDDETMHYDRLVIAAGTTNNFFNMPQLKDTVYTLKSVAESLRCRNDFLDRLERASMEDDAEKRRQLLSFVVVGGGPTGVEIAGAFGEMKRYVLPREYPQIDQEDVSITILEGTDRLLRTMSEKSSAAAARYLKSLMVKVRLGHNMKSYEEGVVTLDDDTTLSASMVVWTAGVKGVDFEWTGDTVKPVRGGRLEVDEYCRVKGVDHVWALGDIAMMVTPDLPMGHPQLAQVAIQQARCVAENFKPGATPKAFVYDDKGTMATVGRNRAVVDLKHLHFDGFWAWLTWMVVHLMSLLGMRNKVSVFVDWVWAYFTYSSSTRLLLHPAKYPLRKRWLKE